MNDKRLADIIATYLPISTEDSELLVTGIQKGYLSDTVNHTIGLATRDRAIEELMRRNEFLIKQNELLKNKLRYLY